MAEISASKDSYYLIKLILLIHNYIIHLIVIVINFKYVRKNNVIVLMRQKIYLKIYRKNNSILYCIKSYLVDTKMIEDNKYLPEYDRIVNSNLFKLVIYFSST